MRSTILRCSYDTCLKSVEREMQYKYSDWMNRDELWYLLKYRSNVEEGRERNAIYVSTVPTGWQGYRIICSPKSCLLEYVACWERILDNLPVQSLVCINLWYSPSTLCETFLNRSFFIIHTSISHLHHPHFNIPSPSSILQHPTSIIHTSWLNSHHLFSIIVPIINSLSTFFLIHSSSSNFHHSLSTLDHPPSPNSFYVFILNHPLSIIHTVPSSSTLHHPYCPFIIHTVPPSSTLSHLYCSSIIHSPSFIMSLHHPLSIIHTVPPLSPSQSSILSLHHPLSIIHTVPSPYTLHHPYLKMVVHIEQHNIIGYLDDKPHRIWIKRQIKDYIFQKAPKDLNSMRLYFNRFVIYSDQYSSNIHTSLNRFYSMYLKL